VPHVSRLEHVAVRIDHVHVVRHLPHAADGMRSLEEVFHTTVGI